MDKDRGARQGRGLFVEGAGWGETDGWLGPIGQKTYYRLPGLLLHGNGAAFFGAKNWFLMRGSSLSSGLLEEEGGEGRGEGPLTRIITILSAPMTTRVYTYVLSHRVRGFMGADSHRFKG